MISREPTLERLAVAQGLLLAPFGLDETHLARALAEIRAHQVDDADLYFQYTRSEGWSLEEGIVKTGSFSIDQGVGVRAVAGEKTAFAYSDDISEAALLDAARTVRTIAAAGQSRRVKVGGGKPGQGYPAVAYNLRGREGGAMPEPTDVASLRSASGGSSRTYVGVRRLMPVECERLQGMADSYTAVEYNGKPAKDGPRYRAIGNSMAVPVLSWILRRIN